MSYGRNSHGRQNRSSYHHSSYAAWMPLYDPAFALGPFLQLPPYLPSGQVLSKPSGHWYSKGGPHVPSVDADLIGKQPLKQAHAPGFLPASQPNLANDISAIAKRSHGGKAQRQCKEDPTISAIDSATSVSPDLVLPSLAGVNALPEVASLEEIASTTNGTPTCCSSDSVPEDASQCTEAMVSARSGFTSDDASETTKQTGLGVAVSAKEENGAQPGLTTSDLLEIWSADKTTCNVGASFSELLNKPSEKSETSGGNRNNATVDVAVTDPDASCKSMGSKELDLQIIDPEATSSMLSEVSPAAEPKSPDKASPSRGKDRQGCQSPTGLSATPSLDVVLGHWSDAKNSHYEVQYDERTTSSCHVKTSRPGGAVRETSGLIRHGQYRGKSAGRILWGSAFVLETPIACPHELQWKSIRGGKDFTWTRETKQTETTQGAANEKLASASSDSQPVAKSLSQEPLLEQPTQQSHRSGQKPFAHKRVWRAVAEKPEVAENAAEAQPTPTVKTPSEVAAATCRRVKSHSGTWRLIKKTPVA